ncbi:hypothetical protein [Sulfurimonas sp.]|uniref:hypothetical protein n=1 Tax=Sulfurimonas sp. TaxID=2022749 RepID=UPI003569EA49
MAIVSFKAESTTLILNDEVISDFINGDIIELAPVNPDTARTYGSNQSVNIQHRSDRNVHTLKFRVMRDSDSDVFLNEQMNKDTPVVFNGSVKEIYIKDDEELTESFELQAGSFTDKPTHTKNNQDGNAQVEYTVECFARRLI